MKTKEEQLRERLELYEKFEKYEGSDAVITSEEYQSQLSEERKTHRFKLFTSLPKFDEMIQGFREGQMVILSAPTGQGKSTFARSLTKYFSDAGVGCLWFSYEEGNDDLIEAFEEMNCTLPHFFLPKVNEANKLQWLKDRICEGISKYDTKVVFIDHLHYVLDMDEVSKSNNQSMAIGSILRNLKLFAQNHEIIVFLIAHIKTAQFEKSKPSINDIRDSSFIGQESSTVIFVKRQWDGDEATNYSKLWVMKNRKKGKCGSVLLKLVNNCFIEEETGFDEQQNRKSLDKEFSLI